MKPEVERALARARDLRRRVLRRVRPDARIRLLEQLFRDFFVDQRQTLLRWSALTGQSAQVDTGYIAQHVASLVLGEPGQGFKGKGLDLADGSEVKSAAILSGVDRPRWNHNMGTPDDDEKRRSRGLEPKWADYLGAPNVFYLLFDRVEGADDEELVLRVRAWCIDAQEDEAWRNLFIRYVKQRGSSQYNLQLHPPVGYDDDVVVNTLGNLDFTDVKVLDTRMRGLLRQEEFRIHWTLEPPESVRPVGGRSRALPYGGRGARPSRLTTAAEMAVDMDVLADLVPGVDLDAVRAAMKEDQIAADEEQ